MARFWFYLMGHLEADTPEQARRYVDAAHDVVQGRSPQSFQLFARVVQKEPFDEAWCQVEAQMLDRGPETDPRLCRPKGEGASRGHGA